MEANNAQALREALEKINRLCGIGVVEVSSFEIGSICDAALAKPPRACDLMSQEDLTRVVISGFMKSLGIEQENQLVSQLAEAAISAAIKCAYDTQLVSKGEGGAK